MGFIKQGDENKVCLLKKSLYGLKQSSCQWYRRFDSFMTKSGFIRNEFDNCVYIKESEDGIDIYLLLYVDDMLVASKSKSNTELVKELLRSEFEMKNIGKSSKILGMKIRRNRSSGSLSVSQGSYIQKVFKKFNMEESKPVLTPLAHHFKLSLEDTPKTEKEIAYMERIPYANSIGSLMYAMVCTRPDLDHAKSLESFFFFLKGV